VLTPRIRLLSLDTRERAALAWAETVTRVADTAVPDADFQADDRLAIGFRVPPKAALSE
jgi:alkylhydroperoxidase family enzyme